MTEKYRTIIDIRGPVEKATIDHVAAALECIDGIVVNVLRNGCGGLGDLMDGIDRGYRVITRCETDEQQLAVRRAFRRLRRGPPSFWLRSPVEVMRRLPVDSSSAVLMCIQEYWT